MNVLGLIFDCIVGLRSYNAVKTTRSIVTNQLQNGYNGGVLVCRLNRCLEQLDRGRFHLIGRKANRLHNVADWKKTGHIIKLEDRLFISNL
jgi:hypothetical protein